MSKKSQFKENGVLTVNQSNSEVLLENVSTRITYHHIKPGQETGWHRHSKNYVAYHLKSGELIHQDSNGSGGKIKSELGKANFYDVGKGFDHNAINVGDDDIIALEIEYKK
tara:strand:- start:1377 stop:1709 length:333 start_codon:yes stop_codon:yes gene_type:complete